MNEKGWCSALGGSFAVVRTARLYHRQKILRAPHLSFTSAGASFPFVFFLSLSLARISATAVSKLFLCLAVKGRPVERCVYIRACSRGSAVTCDGASSVQPWIMQSRESRWLRVFLPWIVTNRDPPRAFVQRGVIFSVFCAAIHTRRMRFYPNATERCFGKELNARGRLINCLVMHVQFLIKFIAVMDKTHD